MEDIVVYVNEKGKNAFKPSSEMSKEDREKASNLYDTQVTDLDFKRMSDMTTDYYKGKVEKLLRERPFNLNK